MSTDKWQPEALIPFSRAVRRLYDAAVSRFPLGILDRHSIDDGSACDRLRAWILKIGKSFGGMPRQSNAPKSSVRMVSGVSDLGAAVEQLTSPDRGAPSGLFSVLPTRLLGQVPGHLIPDLGNTDWIGLYPTWSLVSGENAQLANTILEEIAEQEFAAAFFLPQANPKEARPKLLALALEFRLHALRLAHWAKRQMGELRDALCPRLRVGDFADVRHFKVGVTLAGFNRLLKLRNKQAVLLVKLIRKRGHAATATKHQIRALRKSLPEISTFISEKGGLGYALASEVCARAKLATCWNPPRPNPAPPRATNPAVTPKS